MLIILIFVSFESYNKPPVGLLFIILICISSDTGGYVVGNLIGGRKLTKMTDREQFAGRNSLRTGVYFGGDRGQEFQIYVNFGFIAHAPSPTKAANHITASDLSNKGSNL